MTIDEAIECERNHRLYPEYHEQLAEWLEELKAYKKNSNTCPMCDTYCSYLAEEFENGYNKAIDDFANVLKENYDYLPQILSQEAFGRYIDEYEERLKEGAGNGTDNQ